MSKPLEPNELKALSGTIFKKDKISRFISLRHK